jgi:hypothetical protein
MHAVRFAHETGMIFSEPLSRPRAERLVRHLAAFNIEAQLIEAGEGSDTQPHFQRATWDDRCVLIIPGVGTVALVRVLSDVAIRRVDPLAAIAVTAGQDDWPEDVRVEFTDEGRRLAGLEPSGSDRDAPRIAPRPSTVRFLAWTIHVLAHAVFTVEGIVIRWIVRRPRPQDTSRRPACSRR